MNWKYIIKGDPKTYPIIPEDLYKRNLSNYPCLCHDTYLNEYIILNWNNEYGCWDDTDGDDYYCDADRIDKYEFLSYIIGRLDNAYDDNNSHR